MRSDAGESPAIKDAQLKALDEALGGIVSEFMSINEFAGKAVRARACIGFCCISGSIVKSVFVYLSKPSAYFSAPSAVPAAATWPAPGSAPKTLNPKPCPQRNKSWPSSS